jgi:hypothetical protein
MYTPTSRQNRHLPRQGGAPSQGCSTPMQQYVGGAGTPPNGECTAPNECRHSAVVNRRISLRGAGSGVAPQSSRRRRRGSKRSMGVEDVTTDGMAPNELMTYANDLRYDHLHRETGPQPPFVNLFVNVRADASLPDQPQPNEEYSEGRGGTAKPQQDEILAAQLSRIYARTESVLTDHAAHVQEVNVFNAERATELWLQQKSAKEQQSYLERQERKEGAAVVESSSSDRESTLRASS